MAVELLRLKPVARVMYAACYRKGPLLSTHSEPGQRKDNLWYDVPQQCHQRSRSISSALVSGSHSLSGASGGERNTADVQYRPSNLFISWRARALDSRNNFLVGLPELNTKWIQIRKSAQLTGRENSCDDDDKVRKWLSIKVEASYYY